LEDLIQPGKPVGCAPGIHSIANPLRHATNGRNPTNPD
jgi:hypothetical protein